MGDLPFLLPHSNPDMGSGREVGGEVEFQAVRDPMEEPGWESGRLAGVTPQVL